VAPGCPDRGAWPVSDVAHLGADAAQASELGGVLVTGQVTVPGGVRIVTLAGRLLCRVI
jgi:hypothetical protein